MTHLRSAQIAQASSSYLASAWCPGDPGRTTDDKEHALTNLPDVKVIYAYAKDQPNRFLKYASEIQESMKRLSTLVADHPGSSKSVRFDLGTACGPQYLDIQTVQLPKDLDEYRQQNGNSILFDLVTARELEQAGVGPADHPRRYVVYLDGLTPTDGALGAAYPQSDDRPGPENTANGGRGFGLLFGRGTDTFFNTPFYGDYVNVHVPLHELWHTIGAVVPSAPHASTPEGHCFDEWDILCGQSTGIVESCPGGPSNLELDCNDDDYFNPAGPIMSRATSSSPSREIWNTYNSAFLCHVSRCSNRRPAAAITATPSATLVNQSVTLNAGGSSDDDSGLRFQWDLDGNGGFESDTGTSASTSAVYGTPGTYRPAVKVTDSDGMAVTASTTVEVRDRPAPPGITPPVGAVETTITAGPPAYTNDPTPTFAFSATEGAAGFQCGVDPGAFTPCSSPFTTAPLTDGLHAFRVRAVNAAGEPDPTPATRAFTVDTRRPAVQQASISPTRFRVGGRARATRGTPAGATIRYRLSEAASVTIAIDRLLPGRRSGRRCLAPSRRLRRARPCDRLARVGILTPRSRVGRNAVPFSGKIGSRTLQPGRYRATIAALDRARNRSRPVSVAFTVVRR